MTPQNQKPPNNADHREFNPSFVRADLPTAAVFIALGANLGDPVAQIRAALRELSAWSSGPARASSLWSSTPADCPPGSPDFVNAVLQLIPSPEETPETLLGRLQTLEQAAGRTPKIVLNEARPLDLDLLAWGEQTRSTPQLILPHPRAHLRRFVLAPLAELAPEFVLPGQTRCVAELLALTPPDSRLRRLS